MDHAPAGMLLLLLLLLLLLPCGIIANRRPAHLTAYKSCHRCLLQCRGQLRAAFQHLQLMTQVHQRQGSSCSACCCLTAGVVLPALLLVVLRLPLLQLTASETPAGMRSQPGQPHLSGPTPADGWLTARHGPAATGVGFVCPQGLHRATSRQAAAEVDADGVGPRCGSCGGRGGGVLEREVEGRAQQRRRGRCYEPRRRWGAGPRGG
jgi:hypothetical protein